jgi:hypothetical protein
MEQLALFALPTNDAELDDDSSDGDEDGDSEHEGVPLASKDPIDIQYDRTDWITWPGKGDLRLQYNVSETPRDVAIRFIAQNDLPVEETTSRIMYKTYSWVPDSEAESGTGTRIEDCKVNYAKSIAARARGRQNIAKSDWRGAVEAYTEAIKYTPTPDLYNSRALAFFNISEFQSAIEDYDKAIQGNGGDVKFVSPYVRKAEAYFSMKEYAKCLETCDQVSKADTRRTFTKEIERLREAAITLVMQDREKHAAQQVVILRTNPRKRKNRLRQSQGRLTQLQRYFPCLLMFSITKPNKNQVSLPSRKSSESLSDTPHSPMRLDQPQSSRKRPTSSPSSPLVDINIDRTGIYSNEN